MLCFTFPLIVFYLLPTSFFILIFCLCFFLISNFFLFFPSLTNFSLFHCCLGRLSQPQLQVWGNQKYNLQNVLLLNLLWVLIFVPFQDFVVLLLKQFPFKVIFENRYWRNFIWYLDFLQTRIKDLVIFVKYFAILGRDLLLKVSFLVELYSIKLTLCLL